VCPSVLYEVRKNQLLGVGISTSSVADVLKEMELMSRAEIALDGRQDERLAGLSSERGSADGIGVACQPADDGARQDHATDGCDGVTTHGDLPRCGTLLLLPATSRY